MKGHTHELLRGTLTVIILRLLAQYGRMYGYELTQKVKELTNSRIQITEGALYPALHKLEAEGAIISEVEFIGRRQRRYYKLTSAGITTASDRISDLNDFLFHLQLILQ